MNMKAVSIFEYGDYKSYLRAWINSQPSKGRGKKRQLAQIVKCHSTYVSQILHGSADLSPEQASLLNGFMGHNSQEARFFILLVQRARAGNKSLREHFEIQIQEVLDSRSALRNRLEIKKTIEEKDQATYYSSWLYPTIHMLITMPEFQTRDELSKHLHLPVSKVMEILSFLVAMGLAEEQSGKFVSGRMNIYLGDNSPLISKHHTNWRMRAVQSLDVPRMHDLHYSSLATVNSKDIPAVREILVKAIEQIRAIVKASSPEDALFCYNLDLFGL